MDIIKLVSAYSPWLDPDRVHTWRDSIPRFRRPLFHQLRDDLKSVPQIISITGPRRVGKSTILQQLVDHLLTVEQVDPSRVIYYSMDDPARIRVESAGESLIEELMVHMCEIGRSGDAYLFLDEIQTLERWEQHLKKYYDLRYPVRCVISGSASSPIFKKSRESLLGRVKDYHLLPFSFREFLMFHEYGNDPIQAEIAAAKQIGDEIRGMFTGSPDHLDLGQVAVPRLSDELWDSAEERLTKYLIEGGFPEVWAFPTEDKKIEYLYDNQIKKVIDEDLVLAVEFRKPEQLKKFYISLLEQPGREVNLTKLSSEIGVNVQQVEKYLPLLEMTDLIAHADKFRESAVRVRRGNQKFYLVDLALRNAVLRIGEDLLRDDGVLGLYAENLVFNALRKWRGVLTVDYYRDSRHREVDFIVHTRPKRFLPIEVKYQSKIDSRDFSGLSYFQNHYPCNTSVVVAKERADFGVDPKLDAFRIPLIHFLLMFD